MGFHGPSVSTAGKCYLRAKCGQMCCRHSKGDQLHLLICKESRCSERTMKSTEFLHQSLPWLFISLWHVTINLRALDSNNSSWRSPVFPGSGIRESPGWLLSGLFGSPEAAEHTGFLCDTWDPWQQVLQWPWWSCMDEVIAYISASVSPFLTDLGALLLRPALLCRLCMVYYSDLGRGAELQLSYPGFSWTHFIAQIGLIVTIFPTPSWIAEIALPVLDSIFDSGVTWF